MDKLIVLGIQFAQGARSEAKNLDLIGISRWSPSSSLVRIAIEATWWAGKQSACPILRCRSILRLAQGVVSVKKSTGDPSESELQSLMAAMLNQSAIESSGISREFVVSIDKVLAALDSGVIRAVDQVEPGRWRINRLVVEAVVLSSQVSTGNLTRAGDLGFFDHLPTKFAGLRQADLVASGIRLVPPAVTRRGSYLGRDVVIMPSFVGVGAYVDEGSMIDSWASIGRCAQVGRKVHVSVNAVVGDSSAEEDVIPAVVEDSCFIGAGAVIADGVIVEAHSVIGMGVLVDRHTPIFDRNTGAVWYGRIPSGSVVVAGSVPSGNRGLAQPCALIVKRVDEQTRARVDVNDLLRN